MPQGSPTLVPVEHDPWANLPQGPVEARQGPMGWRDWAPFVGAALREKLTQGVHRTVGAAALPGNVLQGKVDPGSPEGFAQVQDLAGLAMVGPSGSVRPKGALGSGLAGQKSVAVNEFEAALSNIKAGKNPYPIESDLYSHIKTKGQGSLTNEWIIEGKPMDIASGKDVATVALHSSGGDPKLAITKLKHYADNFDEDAVASAIKQLSKPFIELTDKAVPLLANDVKILNAVPEGMEPQAYTALWQHHFHGDKLSEVASAANVLHGVSGQPAQDFIHAFGVATGAIKAPVVSPKPLSVANSWSPHPSVVSNPHPSNPNWFTNPTATPKQVPIDQALYPINWNELTSTVSRPGQQATGEYANVLQRAEAQGFNTNFPIYKGLEPGEWAMQHEGEAAHAWSDPATKHLERGIFASDTPEISNQYTMPNGQNFKMFANPQKTLAVHWPEVADSPSYSASTMHKLIEAARAQEAEALVIHGMRDLGGPQSQYVFMKPNILRSVFAQFDPTKRESANLLHSGGTPLFLPVDHDPFAELQNEP